MKRSSRTGEKRRQIPNVFCRPAADAAGLVIRMKRLRGPRGYNECMSEEKFGQRKSRRSFLKEVGAAVVGGTAITQIMHALTKVGDGSMIVQSSMPEQISALTHYGPGVKDALEQQKDRILFDPETGKLRVLQNGRVIYDDLQSKQRRIQNIAVMMSSNNYSLVFVYNYPTGGFTVEIKNIYGEILEIETSGGVDMKPQK